MAWQLLPPLGRVSPCWSPSGTLGQTPLLVMLLLWPSCRGGNWWDQGHFSSMVPSIPRRSTSCKVTVCKRLKQQCSRGEAEGAASGSWVLYIHLSQVSPYCSSLLPFPPPQWEKGHLLMVILGACFSLDVIQQSYIVSFCRVSLGNLFVQDCGYFLLPFAHP